MTTYNAALTRVSGNKKTGPIATSMTARDTCPDACPLKVKGCYASYGPTGMHWRKVSSGERGRDWSGFCDEVRALPSGSMLRHNVAGDLPGNGSHIDAGALRQLVAASKRLQAFTYTHYQPEVGTNLASIEEANANGFVINMSANNAAQAADYFKRFKAPIVCLLPKDAPNVQTVDGVKVVACPADKSEKISCATCKMCAVQRPYVIGFRAHGTAAKTVDLIAKA